MQKWTQTFLRPTWVMTEKSILFYYDENITLFISYGKTNMKISLSLSAILKK